MAEGKRDEEAGLAELAKAYNEAMLGVDHPEVMWIPSPQGPVLITREKHYLCNDAGNPIAEIDKSYAEEYFRSFGH